MFVLLCITGAAGSIMWASVCVSVCLLLLVLLVLLLLLLLLFTYRSVSRSRECDYMHVKRLCKYLQIVIVKLFTSTSVVVVVVAVGSHKPCSSCSTTSIHTTTTTTATTAKKKQFSPMFIVVCRAAVLPRTFGTKQIFPLGTHHERQVYEAPCMWSAHKVLLTANPNTNTHTHAH